MLLALALVSADSFVDGQEKVGQPALRHKPLLQVPVLGAVRIEKGSKTITAGERY